MDLKLDVEELITLRHLLHENAEVSNYEIKTAKIIGEFLKNSSLTIFGRMLEGMV